MLTPHAQAALYQLSVPKSCGLAPLKSVQTLSIKVIIHLAIGIHIHSAYSARAAMLFFFHQFCAHLLSSSQLLIVCAPARE